MTCVLLYTASVARPCKGMCRDRTVAKEGFQGYTEMNAEQPLVGQLLYSTTVQYDHLVFHFMPKLKKN